MNLPRFAAAVLAGGFSTRMGRDKAHLPARDGRPLLLRQLQLLASLNPDELWVSARAGQILPPLPDDAQRIDDAGDLGPLGGIVQLLRVSSATRLLVLAVDLPDIDQPTLQRLLTAGPGGAIAEHLNHWEPLVGVYPRAWLPLAERHLANRRLSLQQVLRDPESAACFTVVSFPDSHPFTNWNAPADLARETPRH